MSESMLDMIDYSQLRIIAGGTYNVVLTDGVFAIKIGTQVKAEIEKQRKLYTYGIGIPVYFSQRNSVLDQRIVDLITQNTIYSCGSEVSYNRYIYKKNNQYFADVAVYALAEPMISHDAAITDELAHEINTYVIALQKKAEKHRIFWKDAHIYNVGFFNGAAVILDV